MSQGKRWKLAVLILLLLLASLNTPFIGLVVKLFVDLFAVGDSFMKVYLFLLMLLVALVSPRLDKLKNVGKTTSLLLATLLVFGFVEHVYVLNQVGLPFYGSGNFVFDGDYSSTRLDHIHVPKVALSLLLQSMSYQFDAGLPYQHYFPKSLLFFQLCLLGLAGLGCIFSLVEKREDAVGEFALDCVLWFVLIKGCVDGGPLNAELIAVLPVHLFRVWKLPLKVGCPSIWGAYFLGMSATWGLPILRLYHLLSTLFVLVMMWLLFKKQQKWIVLVLALGIVLFPTVRARLHPSLRYSHQAMNLLSMAMISLKPGDVVYVTKAGTIESNSLAKVLDVQIQEPYRTAKLEIGEKTSVYGVCRAFGLHIARAPVQFSPQYERGIQTKIWKPGDPAGTFELYEARLPAGASTNFFVAGMPKGSVFLRVRLVE